MAICMADELRADKVSNDDPLSGKQSASWAFCFTVGFANVVMRVAPRGSGAEFFGARGSRGDSFIDRGANPGGFELFESLNRGSPG